MVIAKSLMFKTNLLMASLSPEPMMECLECLSVRCDMARGMLSNSKGHRGHRRRRSVEPFLNMARQVEVEFFYAFNNT